MSNEDLVKIIQLNERDTVSMLQLWHQNKKYIYKIVNRYSKYADEEDLQQESYLGLYEAAMHYKQEKGIRFITYAGYWIRQKLVRYIKKNGTVRLPEFMHTRIRKYNMIITKWEQTQGRRPSDEEICHCLDINKKTLEEIKKAAEMAKIASLDVPADEEGEGSLYDLLPAAGNEEEEILNRIQREQICAVLWPMVDALPDQQPETLRARYQEGRTLKDIAQDRKTSPTAVRQQELKGLKELRNPRRKRQLWPFLEDMLYSKG